MFVCRLRVAWYEFSHGNQSVISWGNFSRGCTAQRGNIPPPKKNPFYSLFIFLMDLLASFNAAVKVQKSNNHHWDPSGNYCHPPHGSHSKTWSSPSHPHNQQDHCKCKLSLMTAPLLARHGGGRSLFPSLPFCTFVQSFSESFTSTLSARLYLAPSPPCTCATDLTAEHMANVSCLKCSAAPIV